MPETETETEQAQHVDGIAQPAYETLEDNTKKLLSKVLFPDTITEKVTVLGKIRTLRPLPIKWSKRLYNELDPLTNKILTAQNDPEVQVDYTNDLLAGLILTGQILCDYYKWDDIKEAIDDEACNIADLQALIMAQRSVQGTSDFMFQPCSMLVGLMQLSEIGVAVIMNALSGQAT